MVWQGKDVVKQGRAIIGATNPLASAPGTIRGDYAIDVGRCENPAHARDPRSECTADAPVGQERPCCRSSFLTHNPRLLIFLPFSNIIHGSDAVESAMREIGLWFPELSSGVPNYDVRAL